MTHSLSYRRILSKMGYYDYQNGLIYNHLNQDGGWDNHLGRCRRLILEMLDLHKPETVTILGSGWLLDLPLAEMMERHCRINLVDIVHPPEVVRQAGELEDVTIIETDITGGLIQSVWNEAGRFTFFRKRGSVSSLQVPEFHPDFDTGLVISLNILTQLESQLLIFLRKKSVFPEDELLQFRKTIQDRHIDFLKKRRSLLITDYEEVETRKTGEVRIVPTLLSDLSGARLLGEWTWDFDLKGHENYNSTIVIREKSVAW